MKKYWPGTNIQVTWLDKILLWAIGHSFGYRVWVRSLEERAWAEEMSDEELLARLR